MKLNRHTQRLYQFLLLMNDDRVEVLIDVTLSKVNGKFYLVCGTLVQFCHRSVIIQKFE